MSVVEKIEVTDQPTEVAQVLETLAERYQEATPEAIIEGMVKREFAGGIALVSSFGTESAVLLHMVAQVDPATPIIFLDTGKLFGETKRYRDQLVARFGFSDVRVIGPDPKALTERDPKGVLWSQNADACCALRKVEPLERALKGFSAWFTGRKAFQASTRTQIRVVEWQGGFFKVNPLARSTRADLDAYFKRHDLPHHPLEADGYLSVGCIPCTTRVRHGEDVRAGRWRGLEKTECGIHLPTEDYSI